MSKSTLTNREEKRFKVKILMELYHSIPKVQELTGFDKRFIRCWDKRFRDGEDYHDRPRSGRPKKITKEIGDFVELNLLDKPYHYPSQLVSVIRTDFGIQVSKSTIIRYIRSRGIRSRSPRGKVVLTDTHKQKRIQFCENNLTTNWNHYTFTDESSIMLYPKPNPRMDRQWTRQKKANPLPKLKWISKSNTVKFWGAITLGGKFKLRFYSGGLTSHKYIKILKKFRKEVRKHKGKSITFQQDGHPAHTAKGTLKFCNKVMSKVVTAGRVGTWPSYSPDLNPIEYMGYIKTKR